MASTPETSARSGGGLLLTGATGFVGMELLARYLDGTDRTIHALVRGRDDDEAAARVRSTLATLYGSPTAHAGRVIAVPGDIERDGLAMSARRRAELAGRVTDVVHCAASVSFSLPLEESRRINVEGTRRMLDFALAAQSAGGVDRFAHVSTAYVSGTHAGDFMEDQLDVGQGFRNAYERSKFEGEMLVRAHADRLGIQIFRPSIVVGERDTGWTSSFNVLYSPLKAFARGALPFLPARRSSPVDVVPVDFVADAIFALGTEPVQQSGETFNLVSGAKASTVGGLADRMAEPLGRRPPRILPPALYRRLLHPLLVRRGPERRRRALARTEVFFPYFAMRPRFDDRRARRRLERHGVAATPVERYLPRLIDFAQAAEWGRRPLPRA